MWIIAVDPGTTHSAEVHIAVSTNGEFDVMPIGIMPNYSVLLPMRSRSTEHFRPVLVVEQIESFGMAVGTSVFETVFWTGRFCEAHENIGGRCVRLPRRAIKLHLCGTSRAKDANIRQALIDRFGGKDVAVGTKNDPGPLYGMKSHLWAALAVGITYYDMQQPGYQDRVAATTAF